MAAIATNRDAADVLFNVATILELAEDNPYRVRAYRRAARLLLRSREDAHVKLTDKQASSTCPVSASACAASSASCFRPAAWASTSSSAPTCRTRSAG